MLPAPRTIVQSGWALIVAGELRRHLGACLLRAAIGFLSGSVLGVALGVAMTRSPLLHGTINPLVQMFRAVPSLAFVPLAIFWFGIGETSKIVLIAWGVFFSVWVSTYVGVRDVSPLLGRPAASLGARGWRNFAYVVIPARCRSSSPGRASACPLRWSCCGGGIGRSGVRGRLSDPDVATGISGRSDVRRAVCARPDGLCG
ncbi:ABC transporter permease [Bradyrhizobium sp. ma5]|uniref:ABC transporter permease n=1 Tax=Bradyrhizobium sp. ma5 TaxID=3344828 RepID=UPI0035D4C49F